MNALRIEVKDDISKIREAVQTIDRSVSQIKGFLGLNGAPSDAPHPHVRATDEQTTHLHHRLDDLIKVLENKNPTVVTTTTTTTEKTDPPITLTWKTAAVVAAFLVAILFALASDRAREALPKPPSMVTPAVPR